MPAVVSAAMTDGVSDPAASRPKPKPVPVVTAQTLLRGGRKLLIEHEGEVYTLQLTRQNKLLLTK